MKKLLGACLLTVIFAVSASAFAQDDAAGGGGKMRPKMPKITGPCRAVQQACKAQNMSDMKATWACFKAVKMGSTDKKEAATTLESQSLTGKLTEDAAMACNKDKTHHEHGGPGGPGGADKPAGAEGGAPAAGAPPAGAPPAGN